MKLFDDFEAVRFSEENMIFITHDGWLYYLYHSKSKSWRKYRHAGMDHITVSHYQDVSKKELEKAMQGVFPKKETDFMRLCDPSGLWIRDMLALLNEDYSIYMSDYSIYNTIHSFLLESDICHKSFKEIKKLLDNATANHQENRQVLDEITELCFNMIGRDIFKKEIGIVDGHDGSSYFWIMPVRVMDYANTNLSENVAEMKGAEISIEEDDVCHYLVPFLYKYYDDELEANQKRVDHYWIDDDGNEQTRAVIGFEWYLTHNFFTFDSMTKILTDIQDTIDALSSGRETEYTVKLRCVSGVASYEWLYVKNLTEEQMKEYDANFPKKDDAEIALMIDFYHRFIYRIEHMMKVGKEKGYNLISFMGP